METKKSRNFLRKKNYANNIFYEKTEFTALCFEMDFSIFFQNFLKGFLKIGHL
jgi:hypothetical protein